MDHKDSKFDFSQSELELVCDKSFFTQKAQILGKIKGQFARLEEAIHEMDLSFLPKEAMKRGKISQGENYQGAPWVVLDAPAYFSGKNIFAFRHIFLWGLNISSTFHVSGKFLEKIDFEAIYDFMIPDLMILTGENPFIHHKDPSVYKPISELPYEEIRELKHLRISSFSNPNDWERSMEKCIPFIKEMRKVIMNG
ncbi:MAG: hypothetical protein ACKO9S_05775 [Bacteroidota bacterium]